MKPTENATSSAPSVTATRLNPGPHRSGDVAHVLEWKVTTVAPLRNSLIAKGMIFSPAHGDKAFTVPLFGAFMQRIMPQLRGDEAPCFLAI
ncbi:MAG: hypothetical protein OXH60_07725 [Rhodospirillales bacterium]|nr:hypothetical protein [Rhodospirillales bacterium]